MQTLSELNTKKFNKKYKYYVDEEFEYTPDNEREVHTEAILYMRTQSHADRFRIYSILKEENKFIVRYRKTVTVEPLK